MMQFELLLAIVCFLIKSFCCQCFQSPRILCSVSSERKLITRANRYSNTLAQSVEMCESSPHHDGKVAPEQSTNTTKVYGVRHGESLSNIWMRQKQNHWGKTTFDDKHNFADAALSETGVEQANQLCKRLRTSPPDWFPEIDLVVVSPLTRTLQTYTYGVRDALKKHCPDVPVLVVPLAAERTFSIAEKGRAKHVIEKEFPELDWSLIDSEEPWWYDPDTPTEFNDGIEYSEWRPNNGQRYLTPGEPEIVFTRRMNALEKYLHECRPEQNILLVAHWGVLRYFSGLDDLKNCEICEVALGNDSNARLAELDSLTGTEHV